MTQILNTSTHTVAGVTTVITEQPLLGDNNGTHFVADIQRHGVTVCMLARDTREQVAFEAGIEVGIRLHQAALDASKAAQVTA